MFWAKKIISLLLAFFCLEGHNRILRSCLQAALPTTTHFPCLPARPGMEHSARYSISILHQCGDSPQDGFFPYLFAVRPTLSLDMRKPGQELEHHVWAIHMGSPQWITCSSPWKSPTTVIYIINASHPKGSIAWKILNIVSRLQQSHSAKESTAISGEEVADVIMLQDTDSWDKSY